MTPGAEVVTRPISAAQAATRRRLLDAARELATEGGYEAVGMRNVAAKAGVSAPTAYQYFSSKDHLLVDLLVELVGQTTTALSARPRPGGIAGRERGRDAATRGPASGGGSKPLRRA